MHHGHPYAITHDTVEFERLDGDWLTVGGGAYARSFGLAFLEQGRRMWAVVPRVVVRLRAGWPECRLTRCRCQRGTFPAVPAGPTATCGGGAAPVQVTITLSDQENRGWATWRRSTAS
jgi:hypothetical protein